MLPYTEHGNGPITLILLPFLAGSQREWTEVIATLARNHRCITTVAEMTDSLHATLVSFKLERYVLVGHSMAGKLSAIIARRALDGDTALHPPIGLVLVAPSPPSPEPMSDSKREQMLEAFPAEAAPEQDLKHAEKYISDNSTRDIPLAAFDRTVADVLKMNRNAWVAWLEGGSKEDWSSRVGIVELPTLLVAGDNDSALGPEPQAEYTQPFFPQAHLIALDTNHLIPLEQPDELAARISNFLKVL
jgi:pimeloyl-ACP methyl ester carboxylesterase